MKMNYPLKAFIIFASILSPIWLGYLISVLAHPLVREDRIFTLALYFIIGTPVICIIGIISRPKYIVNDFLQVAGYVIPAVVFFVYALYVLITYDWPKNFLNYDMSRLLFLCLIVFIPYYLSKRSGDI